MTVVTPESDAKRNIKHLEARIAALEATVTQLVAAVKFLRTHTHEI